MASDKKKVARILRGIKRHAKAPLYAAKKARFIEKQANKMSRKMTWPEREFRKLMKEIGVKILPQKIVGGKIYDFYIPSKNILIEIDGDYWHCNPEIFEEQNAMQRRAARNDEYKDVLAKGLGYGIERIWENDLKKNYNKVKERMKSLTK